MLIFKVNTGNVAKGRDYRLTRRGKRSTRSLLNDLDPHRPVGLQSLFCRCWQGSFSPWSPSGQWGKETRMHHGVVQMKIRPVFKDKSIKLRAAVGRQHFFVVFLMDYRWKCMYSQWTQQPIHAGLFASPKWRWKDFIGLRIKKPRKKKDKVKYFPDLITVLFQMKQEVYIFVLTLIFGQIKF